MKSRFGRGDRGAVAPEYAFILLAIAVALIVITQQIGVGVTSLYQAAVAAL